MAISTERKMKDFWFIIDEAFKNLEETKRVIDFIRVNRLEIIQKAKDMPKDTQFQFAPEWAKSHIQEVNDQMLTVWLDQLEAIQKWAQDMSTKIGKSIDLKFSSMECMGYIIDQRAAGMCMRCSGNAYSFFETSTRRYKIDTDTCQQAIQFCGQYAAIVADMMTYYGILRQLRKIYKG